MAKYIKKQVKIEAFQYLIDEQPVWFKNAVKCKKIKFDLFDNCLIETLEGVMRADKGDYIIKGIKGKIYPCKSDIFEQSYRLFDERKFCKDCIYFNCHICKKSNEVVDSYKTICEKFFYINPDSNLKELIQQACDECNNSICNNCLCREYGDFCLPILLLLKKCE